MKAILINVHNRTVTEVDIDGGLDSLYKALGVNIVEIAQNDLLRGQDVMYVDEEGLLKDNLFFDMDGGYQSIAGNGLIVGTDEDGNSCDAETPLDSVVEAVNFL